MTKKKKPEQPPKAKRKPAKPRRTREEILDSLMEEFPELDYFDALEELLEEESDWYEPPK